MLPDRSSYQSSSAFTNAVSRPRAAAAATHRRARRRVGTPATAGVVPGDFSSDRVSSEQTYGRPRGRPPVSTGTSSSSFDSSDAVVVSAAAGAATTVTEAPMRSRTLPIECKTDEATLKGALADLSSTIYAVRQEVAALRWAMGFLAVGVGDITTQTNASAVAAAAMAASSTASAVGAWRAAGMATAALPPAVTAVPFTGADNWPSTWGWAPAALPPNAAASQAVPSWGWMWAHYALPDATVAASTGVAGGVPSSSAVAAPQEATEATTGRHPVTLTGHEPVVAGTPPARWMPSGTGWAAVDAAAAGLPPDTYAVPEGGVATTPAAYKRPLCTHTMPVEAVALSTYATVPVGGLR